MTFGQAKSEEPVGKSEPTSAETVPASLISQPSLSEPPSEPPSGSAGLRSESSNLPEAPNKELHRLKRALRALSACNQALAQAASEQELLDQVCDIIVRVGGYRMTDIAYAEQDDAKTVRPKAHAGYDSGYLDKIELSWSDSPAGRGPAGTAIRENRICLFADTSNNPGFALWREAALQRGYAAVIPFPLRSGGAAFGVLAIYSEQVDSFEGSEVELLAEIADNLAYGITAIRAQGESKREAAALREAGAKYRQLVEQVPAVSYVAEAGAQGRFLYLSPQAKTVLG